MTLNEMQAEYDRRYANEAYANDESTARLFAILDAAEKLSPLARDEFVQAFEFENALAGELYLGGHIGAARRYPHLLAEGAAVGLRLVTR